MNRCLVFIAAFIALVGLPILGFGQAPNLGTASSFAFFTADGALTNNGASLVTGDIGTNLGAFSGFPIPGTVVGNIRLPNTPEAAQAALDVIAAYNSLTPLACGTTIDAELNGLTLSPGISCQPTASATTLNGTLTLSGAGVYIIKLNSALTTATNSTILLTNGATANKVFFQINGAATLGTGSSFKGTILAMGAIVLSTLATLEGRGLSTVGAITLNNNIVTASLNTLFPDLTPTITLPLATFAAAPNNDRDFIVNIFEVAGQSTSTGNVAITITAPTGYSISFTNSLPSITISGGGLISIDNTKWSVTSATDQQISLKINAGQFIGPIGLSILGFTITRTTANSGSNSNITINVNDDSSHTYDTNTLNNIYARIITSL